MRASDLLKLQDVDHRLKVWVQRVDSYWPLRVFEGKRTLGRQKELKAKGYTKTLQSKHLEGKAVDMAPEGYEWPGPPPPEPATADQMDEWMMKWAKWYAFSAFALGVAKCLGLAITSGLDWDNDKNFREHSFRDAPHFELGD